MPVCFMVYLVSVFIKAVWLRSSSESPLSVFVCAGSVPGSLSSLSELSVLCLANNNLTGVLPHGLAALSKLSVLAVQGNRLKGTPCGKEAPGLSDSNPVHSENFQTYSTRHKGYRFRVVFLDRGFNLIGVHTYFGRERGG